MLKSVCWLDRKKDFPMFLGVLLYGGLNHVMFPFFSHASFLLASAYIRFSFISVTGKTLFAVCCSLIKINFDEDKQDNLHAIDLGICFIIDGGWSGTTWMYFISPLGFLYGLYVSLSWLNVGNEHFLCYIGQ